MDDLDKIMAELNSDDVQSSTIQNFEADNTFSSPYCRPFAYLCDSASGDGQTSNADYPVSCSALRCLKCDLKVARLPDRRWTAGAEYVFLRTNYGMPMKLMEETDYMPGCSAFACQCSKTNVDFGSKKAEKIDGLEWRCSGH